MRDMCWIDSLAIEEYSVLVKNLESYMESISNRPSKAVNTA